MKMPRLTIQVKYITLIAAVVSCTSVILSAYYYNALKAKELTELQAKGRSMTISLAHNSESGVLFSDTEQLSLLVKLLAEDLDAASAEIKSNEGQVLARMATEPQFPDPSTSEFIELLEEVREPSGISMTQYRLRENRVQIFDFSVPIITRRVARGREEVGLMFGGDASAEDEGENVQIGTARVILSSARSFRELQRIQQIIIGITVSVALAGILITVPLVRVTMKPIRELAEGTKKIAAGDLSQRVVATTRDEIGELADSFNQMAIELQEYHAELKEHSQTLEAKVRERTRELLLANEELRKAQAQLIQAAKMAAMGEFGAGVAHELNQPLAGIKGYAQLVLSMVPEDSPLRPRLIQIDRQASRMKEITETMWNLARQSKFEYGFLDIRQPIHDSLILISEQFRQHRIEIITEIEEGLPLVYGDANQLHQAFLNFLTNAKDTLGEKGTGRVKIKAAPVAEGRYLQILVMDNGRGIPARIIDDIFNPFFTTKAPGKGTGLGLSINYSIIEQHHGFCEAYSEESKGTVFSVMLPTDVFRECSKHKNESHPAPVAPCWVSRSTGTTDSHTRRTDCGECEIYKRYQSSPDTSLASALRNFIAQGSEPSSP